MAARRLIVILVLLLAASVVAASLAPDRTRTALPGSSTTTDSTDSRRAQPSGEALSDRIEASPEDPKTVEAFVGDQIELAVGSSSPRTIVIEPLGLSDFAGPDSPAHFNLLLSDAGTIPITDERGAVVGRLQVSDPKDREPRAATTAEERS